MDIELNSVWNKILEEIRAKSSRGTYSLFKQTHLISIENNLATIGAGSIIIISMLQKRFVPEIKRLLAAHTGLDVNIAFITKALPSDKKKDIEEAPLFATSTQTIMSDLKSKPALAQSYGEAKPVGHLPRVRAEFTFSNFAVSSSNQLAFVSATNVARNIGRSYNPFFIYGPVGVGKTHLMHAIANEAYRREPDKKIIYITSEEFTNEVVEAIRHNETAKMKRRFRSAYLLLIDDIQFIEGKEKVQEELFHTFNILIDNGSQIALSSDRPPQEIKKLEKRLSSRFAGGLTVDVEAPDFELKTAIALIKAKKYGYELPIDVAKILAESAEDTRTLEGLLIRIITQATAERSDIDVDMAKEMLRGGIEDKSERLHSDDVIKYVCSFYNVKPTQLRGPKRAAGLVRARQVTMYLLKEKLQMTQVQIGDLLGGRDHTTIMHGVDKIRMLVENKDMVSEDIKRIMKQIGS